MMSDPDDLDRFVAAQAGVYLSALAEIGRGVKRGHWMWFIFPQLAGLGSSARSRHYAIRTLEEAQAYLAHPVLGDRLRECVAALQDLSGGTAQAVFGEVDCRDRRSGRCAIAGRGTDMPGRALHPA